jgi:Domain of unknown function (DUF4349)
MLNIAGSARVRRWTRHTLTWDTGHVALSGLRASGLRGRKITGRRITDRRITGLMVAGVMLVGALALAGCSAGTSSSSASSSGLAQAASGPLAPAGAAAGAAPHQQDGTGTTTARLAPAGDIIYTAQLTVRARSVNPAAATAAQITENAGGYVSNETTSTDPDHPSQATATVQLKIPVPVYQATLSKLEGGLVGAQLSLQQQAQDVTQQVADVNSQVTSDDAAITQLRALLSHAGSVSELLSVQNQINDEETSLEAMQAQQRSLDHEVSYATVTLTILGPQAKPLVHHAKAPPSLAGGLGAGWRALRITVSWTLAFVGAVAPFALIAALAAFVIYRGRRWLLRRRLPAEPTARET